MTDESKSLWERTKDLARKAGDEASGVTQDAVDVTLEGAATAADPVGDEPAPPSDLAEAAEESVDKEIEKSDEDAGEVAEGSADQVSGGDTDKD